MNDRVKEIYDLQDSLPSTTPITADIKLTLPKQTQIGRNLLLSRDPDMEYFASVRAQLTEDLSPIVEENEKFFKLKLWKAFHTITFI